MKSYSSRPGSKQPFGTTKDPQSSVAPKELTLPAHRNQIKRDFILRHTHYFFDPVIMKSANYHHTQFVGSCLEANVLGSIACLHMYVSHTPITILLGCPPINSGYNNIYRTFLGLDLAQGRLG